MENVLNFKYFLNNKDYYLFYFNGRDILVHVVPG